MTTVYQTQPDITPFPVRKNLLAALRMIKTEWFMFVKILALACFVMAVVLYVFRIETPEHPNQSVNPLFGLLNLFVQPWLAVSLFRYLMMNEKPLFWVPRYQENMWSYMWRQFLVILVTFIPATILGILLGLFVSKFAAIIIGLLIVGAATLVTARFSLVAPAAAVDGEKHLMASWHETRGQIFRITMFRFLFALMLLVPFLLVVIVTSLVATISAPAAFVISSWFLLIVQISAMQILDALIYAHFRGKPEVVQHDA